MNIFKKTVSLIAVSAMLLSSLTAVGCDEKKEASQNSPAADVLTEPATQAATEPPKDKFPDIDSFTDEPNGLLGRAMSIRMINDDVVGYIKIPETNVDYPVFQSDDNEKYMDKDMYGDYLQSGCIFMDYRDVIDTDPAKQSNNLVLYGHNMLNGSKFATLHYYRQDDKFIEKAPVIEFDTNYATQYYAIIGYFVTSGSYGETNYGEEFAYWDKENMKEKEFKKYLKTVADRTYKDTGVDVKYGDQLLTLQTCFMDEDNSRFLVIGRKLRDGEKPEDFYPKKKDKKDKDKDKEESEESSEGSEDNNNDTEDSEDAE